MESAEPKDQRCAFNAYVEDSERRSAGEVGGEG